MSGLNKTTTKHSNTQPFTTRDLMSLREAVIALVGCWAFVLLIYAGVKYF